MSFADQANTNEKPLELPQIVLDKTLADLYLQTCPSIAHKRIGHIFCGTTCATDLSPDFPRNKKYIYQDGSFNDPDWLRKPAAEVKRALAPKYLSLIPQRDAFITGKAPVIFFYSGRSGADIEHDEAEAEQTLSVLNATQRPEAIFCSGPADVQEVCADYDIDTLEVKVVVDAIADPSHGPRGKTHMLTDPDVLWFLNGKEALAQSGLPTPATEVVEVHGYCPDAVNCCEICAASKLDDVVESCTGPRRRWIGKQAARILATIEDQALPFVFKNQQAFAGAGTYVVTNESQRNQFLSDLTHGGLLWRLLSRITSENAHLRPGSVLLMSMVNDRKNDYGLTFFVGENGLPIFLAASEQMIDRESSSWVGSRISYQHQSHLEAKFTALVHQIAAWLHKQGYFGPAGADVLESQDGDLQIVDLNVRTSGSLCLPFIKTHFTSRGLQFASSLSVTVRKRRDEFCKQWKTELEAGKLCIVAWYEDKSSGKSFGDLVLGAEDGNALSETLAKLQKLTDQVTF